MPWFKVDDTAHTHPKVIKAGNAALGLWLRAGAYAAQHLTEGAVPGVVVQLYGTAPQARKLVAAGLWHEHGHACPRCAQPAAGDYVVHDFLVYNPTRAKVQSDREAAAKRQQRAREQATARRNRRGNVADSSANADRFVGESSTENFESAPENGAFLGETAGQAGLSRRDGGTPSRSPRPGPTRPDVPPTEVQQQPRTRAGLIPELAPLADALADAGCALRWQLGLGEQRDVWRLVQAHGMPTLVDVVTRRTAPGEEPKPARYWLRVWSDLDRVPAAAPHGSNVVPFRPAAPAALSSHTDNLAAGLALLEKEGFS